MKQVIQRRENLDDFLAVVESLFDEGRLERARAELGRAREIFPESAVLLEWEAVFASDQGRFLEALEPLNGVLEKEPERRFALREKYRVLLELGRFEDCLEILQKLGPDGPRDASYYYNLGSCDDRIGRAGEADGHFARAAAINPRDCRIPPRLSRKIFEKIIQRALSGLPTTVGELMARAHIVIEDYPGPCAYAPFLLALYSPAPRYRQQRPSADTVTYLTLFKRNIEMEFPDTEKMSEEILRMVVREGSLRHGLEMELEE